MMTTQKTFKRRVRARATKTGESYTAARAQLLRTTSPPPDANELVGMTDAALERGSGRMIAEWIEILDASGATERKHPEIARWLVAEHGIGGWWAQSVAVGYEKARGMRPMRRVPGDLSVAVSRTINASADRLSDAFTDASVRAAWLPDAPISMRTSKRGRSARFDWNDPPSLIAYHLTVKSDARTQISLGHEKLPDADAAERIKLMWRERLTVLKELLESS